MVKAISDILPIYKVMVKFKPVGKFIVVKIDYP